MLKERIATHIKTYKEPEIDEEGDSQTKNHKASNEEDKIE